MSAQLAQALGLLLTETLGRKVDVTWMQVGTIRPADRVVVAVFEDDTGNPAALWVSDLANALYAGAALGLYPAQAAKSDLIAGKIDAGLADNYGELLNICTGWVGSICRQHVRFAKLYLTDAEQPPEVKAMRKAAPRPLHLNWNISGYEPGRTTLLR